MKPFKCVKDRLYWWVHIYGSGSDGNATLIRLPNHAKTTLLLDCGLYGLHKRIKCIKEPMRIHDHLIILITHTHSDHICGLSSLLKSNKKEKIYKQISIWCSEGSYNKLLTRVPEEFHPLIQTFKYGNYFLVDKYFGICGFEADHDEPGSCHYHILSLQCSIVFGCDTHTLSQEFLFRAKHYSDMTFLECNYDEEWMNLDRNPISGETNPIIYDDTIKQRITQAGHCSNQYLKSLSDEYKLDLSRVCLMHLSKCYNSNEVVSKRLGEVLIGCDRSNKNNPDVMFKILPDSKGIIDYTNKYNSPDAPE